MTEHVPASTFEAKKHSYRQTQDGIVIAFTVHPNDVSAALAMAPLGTRFMVAAAEITDSEEPASGPGASLSGPVRHEVPAVAPQSGEETAATPSPQVAGGLARAASLPPERRSEIATEAANARWNKDKPTRHWDTLPPATQAGIRCGEERFWEFLAETVSASWEAHGHDAAGVVRWLCDVTSRSELNSNRPAAFRWRALEEEYQTWLTTQAHKDLVR